MLVEMLAPRRRSTMRRVGISALALLGCVLGAISPSRAHAWQATTDAPPTEGRSRLSTPPTDARSDARRTTSVPASAATLAPYVDPWQGIGYEDMALLIKSARRSLSAKLSADAELAPGYVPPALQNLTGIICLRARSSGVLLGEVTTARMPIVESASAAGAALAQSLKKNNVRCEPGGRNLGLELEWLGPFEPVNTSISPEGHWTDELLHSFEPGVEGIAVDFGGDQPLGKQAWTCPSEIVTRNYSPDLALAAAEAKAGIQFIHKVRLQREIRYFRFAALHLWQSTADVLPVRLHRGEVLVDRAAVTARQLDEAIARMRKYLRYLQMADGGFAEEYSPSADRFDHGPTPRLQMHALSSLAALYQWTGQASDRERLQRCVERAARAVKPIHRAELQPTSKYGKAEGDDKAKGDDAGSVKVVEVGLAVQFPGEPECLEPTARLLLAKLALAPSTARNDSMAQGLAKAIRASQSGDGRNDGRNDGRLELMLDYGAADASETVTAGAWGMRALMMWGGSALEAAASSANSASSESSAAVLAVLERARSHYQSWYEREAEPQAAGALARALMQLYGRTNDARCSDLAFAILDRFAALQVTPASCPMPELWGAINAGQPGVVGSDSAAYVSALAEGLELARRIGDGQRAERYEHAVRLGSRFILQLEFTEAGCFYVRTPRDALGGVRRLPWDNQIRVDRCGEALEALIRTRAALYGAPARRGE